MFQPLRARMLVVIACLLGGAILVPTAQAASQTPTSIDGEYATNNLGDQAQQFPVTFGLSNGSVNAPDSLSGFLVPDLTVAITNNLVPVNLGITDFTLSLGASLIDYSIVNTPSSPIVELPNEITSGLKLVSNNTGVNLILLNPALLILTFPSGPSGGVKFDPSWPNPVGTVDFQIVEVPEPASLVYLSSAGMVGLLAAWRRYRRGVHTAAP